MLSETKYRLRRVYRNTADVITLEICDPEGKPMFKYKPGQYVMISYRNDRGRIELRHAFSIASSPTNADKIDLGIKVLGNFTQGLLGLKPGDDIFVSGPYGRFVFDEKKHQDLVMIAGGIGITPFISALEYATDRDLPNKISLLYSVKTKGDLAYFDTIRQLAAANRNLRALCAVTKETSGKLPAGIVNSRLDKRLIGEFLGSVRGKTFFICGPKSFMDAMKANILALGAEAGQIEMEEFEMLPDAGWWKPARNLAYALSATAAIFILIFNQINQPSAAATVNPTESVIDPQSLYQLNQYIYNRWSGISGNKSQAMADLRQRLAEAQAALQRAEQTTPSVPSAGTPQAAAPSPQPTTPSNTVQTPPAPIPAPRPMTTMPMPRTRMS